MIERFFSSFQASFSTSFCVEKQSNSNHQEENTIQDDAGATRLQRPLWAKFGDHWRLGPLSKLQSASRKFFTSLLVGFMVLYIFIWFYMIYFMFEHISTCFKHPVVHRVCSKAFLQEGLQNIPPEREYIGSLKNSKAWRPKNLKNKLDLIWCFGTFGTICSVNINRHCESKGLKIHWTVCILMNVMITSYFQHYLLGPQFWDLLYPFEVLFEPVRTQRELPIFFGLEVYSRHIWTERGSESERFKVLVLKHLISVQMCQRASARLILTCTRAARLPPMLANPWATAVFAARIRWKVGRLMR